MDYCPSIYLIWKLGRILAFSIEHCFLHRKVDMVEIKTAYLEEYKETLMDEIMIRYEDEQKNLLMALIKGMQWIVFPLIAYISRWTFRLVCFHWCAGLEMCVLGKRFLDNKYLKILHFLNFTILHFFPDRVEARKKGKIHPLLNLLTTPRRVDVHVS